MTAFVTLVATAAAGISIGAAGYMTAINVRERADAIQWALTGLVAIVGCSGGAIAGGAL